MKLLGWLALAATLTGCSQAWWEEWAAHDTPTEACQRAYRQDLLAHCGGVGRDTSIACIRLMQADRDRCLALVLPTGSPPLAPVPAVGPLAGEDLVANVSFEIDHAELDPAARVVITHAAVRLVAAGDRPIEIRGHADVTGEGEHNVELSHARAIAVRDALIAAGVDGARIAAGGYGALEPRAPASTEDGRARSRIAEIVLLPEPRTNS